MKKSLLFLAACALYAHAATAEEITENFSDLSGIPTALSSETSAPVSSANGTEYTFTNCLLNTKNSVFNFTNDGAAFTAKLPDNCSSIQLIGASNTTTGKVCQIKFSADGTEVETVTVDYETKNFTFVIPEEYQGAGTTYSFERIGGSNRFSSIVYTVEKAEKEPWDTPEFNIPEESYVLVGQEISVTNVPEGATLDLSYKIKASGESVAAEGSSFTIPEEASASIPCRIFVTAKFSGGNKAASQAELVVNLTNTKRPSVAGCEYVGYENYPVGSSRYPAGAVVVWYNIGIINLGQNTTKVTVTANIYDEDEVNIVKSATSGNLNVAPSKSLMTAEGIQPLEPTVLDKTLAIEGLSNGTYLVELTTVTGDAAPVVVLKEKSRIDVTNTFTTGIEEVEAIREQPAVYYNLQGARVADPRPGQLLIKVEGGKAVKTIIR